MWVVRFTPQPLYLRRKSSCIYSRSPLRDSTDAALQCKSDASPASAVRSHPTSNVKYEMSVNRCSLFWADTPRILIVVYTDVSGELIGSIFKGHAVQEESREQVAEGLCRVWCELRNNSEDRRPHSHDGQSLRSRMNINTLKTNIHPNYLRTSVYLTEDSPCPSQRLR